ncbi:MAG: hypothetical protein KAY08_00695 [Giesbergeria sp.]|nr:hypothetical protein [Giesbergeria sp.]
MEPKGQRCGPHPGGGCITLPAQAFSGLACPCLKFAAQARQRIASTTTHWLCMQPVFFVLQSATYLHEYLPCFEKTGLPFVSAKPGVVVLFMATPAAGGKGPKALQDNRCPLPRFLAFPSPAPVWLLPFSALLPLP